MNRGGLGPRPGVFDLVLGKALDVRAAVGAGGEVLGLGPSSDGDGPPPGDDAFPPVRGGEVSSGEPEAVVFAGPAEMGCDVDAIPAGRTRRGCEAAGGRNGDTELPTDLLERQTSCPEFGELVGVGRVSLGCGEPSATSRRALVPGLGKSQPASSLV